MSGANLKDIAEWFQRGLNQKAAYLIVVCDTFEHDDYPVYVSSTDAFYEKYDPLDNKNMQRIMEVYDLKLPWSQQSQGRTWNMPPRPEPTK